MQPNQGSKLRNFALWAIVLLLVLAMFNLFSPQQKTPACYDGKTQALVGAKIAAGQAPQYCTIDESLLKAKVKTSDPSLVKLTFGSTTVASQLSNGWTGVTAIGGDNDATQMKDAADNATPKVPYVQAAPESGGLLGALIGWLPLLALVGIWIFMARRMQGAQQGLFGLGKSKVKVIMPGSAEKVTFADVAGIDEAKNDLVEVVDYLRDPRKYSQLGGRMPRGILLVGPPGTGKTLLAKAVAGEANVPFLTLSGSDFVEMFVGVGAARVRDLFAQAKKLAPCIMFIDEIDALGRQRGTGLGGGHDEKEQTLNQLLVELSGFDTKDGIMLIGATNRPDVLDPALLRSGRFDRQVVVPNPDVNGRKLIIEVHIRRQNVPTAPDVDTMKIAQGTSGFSGADLENLVNEAALTGARRSKKLVDASDFEAATEKMMLGAERKSLVMTEEELELTCYHEAGHAIASLHVKRGDPVTKVTRVPRGRALGVTLMQPERDRLSQSFGLCKDRLTVAMAGRAAEMLLYKGDLDDVTGGASGDIDAATKIATAMVTEWGFSEKLGPVRYTDNSGGSPFLGMSMATQQTLSEKFKLLIDNEKRRYVSEGLERAVSELKDNWDEVDALAKALLKDETLSGDQVRKLLVEVRSKRAAAKHPAAAIDAPESTASGAADKPHADGPAAGEADTAVHAASDHLHGDSDGDETPSA